ncbi:uncharacterized protein LOC111245205 isoform X2 [Varroa destructor]|uniref:Protein aurora borealis n=1 Tax=Varroa destructor TaxID=109461 RepID=A0A7M7JNN9_VARDE|nr:uncharacterized protein LOC111245205 isoform X2 [Varroa destructor]XP_022648968.1 uncharacterized protein LOC111245205 isoform X2 [Varroa destructor]XP_022648969.1 uncharacterized protein LOC111245205 isoform X2 [Varroa destructor]XP_022648970.1 uncharacterized protein LOC111245205 isoform X2 [Varroa destructor]
MSSTDLMTTPRRSTVRMQDVPLSSTMCQSPSVFVTPILNSTEDIDNIHGGATQQTPNSQFVFIRRGNTRGSSTPKRQVSLCPFTTPDRLGEPLSAQEDFESSKQMINQPLDDTTFSPCIDWQSTMNPMAFDVSNPALYLPPTRTGSAEQRIQNRIAEFFRETKIVPSPCTAEGGGRTRCYLSLDTAKLQDIALSSKRVIPSVYTPKKACVRNMATQTCVTIPPSVDLNKLFAPFATYMETEVPESFMDASRSSSSSSDSICSISRRKLFTEEDESPVVAHNCPRASRSVEEEDKKEIAVFQKNHNFNDTIALSSPPRTMRTSCSVLMNSFESPDQKIESSRLMCHDFYKESDKNLLDCDRDEIPRGEFHIELSPIKSPQRTCYSSQLQVSSLQIGDSSSSQERITSAMATKSSDQGFQSREGCSSHLTTSHVGISNGHVMR